MEDYEILINNQELKEIIGSINEKNKDFLLACHGKYHTTQVINNIEKILSGLGFSKKVIELSKIAGLLHDIGAIQGKKDHATRSSEMAKKFLDLTTISKEEKEIIIESIYDHSNGLDINSPIGASLIIGDKIDLSKNRILELGYKDSWHKNVLNILDYSLIIENKKIIVNYETNSNFFQELFINGYPKGYLLPQKASAYLEC